MPKFKFQFRVYKHGEVRLVENDYIAICIHADSFQEAVSMMTKVFPDVDEWDTNNVHIEPLN